jgi:hypothetical protein
MTETYDELTARFAGRSYADLADDHRGQTYRDQGAGRISKKVERATDTPPPPRKKEPPETRGATP